MCAHWNISVLNKYIRDTERHPLPRHARYEDSITACATVVCCGMVSVATGVSLTAGLGVASRISAGVCSVDMEVGGMKSDGARVDASVTPGMVGSVEDRTVGIGRGEMPGRFRGGRGGRPTEREKSLYQLMLTIKIMRDHVTPSVCVYLL